MLDADGNGTLAGDELAGLGLWMDDGDAVLEAGELLSVADAGIAEISTEMQLVEGTDGKALMQSTATFSDGSAVLTEDVWFAADIEPMINHMAAIDEEICDGADMEIC